MIKSASATWQGDLKSGKGSISSESGARVTLIEPGMVNTPFFDDPKPDALRPEDIARAVSYALAQPASVEVHDVLVLPTPKKD